MLALVVSFANPNGIFLSKKSRDMKNASFDFEVIITEDFTLEEYGLCSIVAFYQANQKSRTPGECHASNAHFSGLLNCSESTIKRTIKRSEERGFIEVIGMGKNRRLVCSDKWFSVNSKEVPKKPKNAGNKI